MVCADLSVSRPQADAWRAAVRVRAAFGPCPAILRAPLSRRVVWLGGAHPRGEVSSTSVAARSRRAPPRSRGERSAESDGKRDLDGAAAADPNPVMPPAGFGATARAGSLGGCRTA